MPRIPRVLATITLILSGIAVISIGTILLISIQMKAAKTKVLAFRNEVSLGSSSLNLPAIAKKHHLRYQWNPGSSEPTPQNVPTPSGSFVAFSGFTVSTWQCVVSFENGLVLYKSKAEIPD